MPIPIPSPGPIPAPAPGLPTVPGSPEDARGQPFWLGAPQPWASSLVAGSHLEALYLLGELSMFVLMWRARDLQNGLVSRCQTCQVLDERAFAAYEQPTRWACPDCYGTTFEGGFRAQLVRPALWVDRIQDTQDSRRGEVTTSTLSLETTGDFTLHTGDYVFRLGGARYQCAELDSPPVRTGFEAPDPMVRVSGLIDRLTLEDPSSVAYLIPPTPEGVEEALTVSAGAHLVSAESSPWDIVRGPLVMSF